MADVKISALSALAAAASYAPVIDATPTTWKLPIGAVAWGLPQLDGSGILAGSYLAAGGTAANFYRGDGTFANNISGPFGIGVSTLTAYTCRNSQNITGGAQAIGYANDATVQSDVTNVATYYYAAPSTLAAAFTLATMYGYRCVGGTVGAGSAITTQIGFGVDSSLTGAATNYGFWANLAVSGTARWNIFVQGTAPVYLGNNQVSMGTASTLNASALLTMTSTTKGLLPPVMTLAQVQAISTPAAGLYAHNSSDKVPNVYDGTNWQIPGRLLPLNSQSAAYQLVIGDAGKVIFHPAADTTARTFTIPANSSVAFSVGTEIDIINETSAGVVTIAITTDTLLFAGAGTTGSRTLAASGWARLVKITSTKWIITNLGGLT